MQNNFLFLIFRGKTVLSLNLKEIYSILNQFEFPVIIIVLSNYYDFLNLHVFIILLISFYLLRNHNEMWPI